VSEETWSSKVYGIFVSRVGSHDAHELPTYKYPDEPQNFRAHFHTSLECDTQSGYSWRVLNCLLIQYGLELIYKRNFGVNMQVGISEMVRNLKQENKPRLEIWSNVLVSLRTLLIV